MAKLDHAKRVLKYEILGLFFVVLSVVALGDLGAVGQALDDLCVMLAGNWHFIIPLYVMWVAVMTMVRRNRFRYTMLQTGIVLLLLVVLTWSEMDLYLQAVAQYNTQNPDLLHLTQVGITSLTQSLKVIMFTSSGSELPPAAAGGGMVGYALFAGLRYLFSVVGTMLVLIVTGITAFVLITRKSLVGMIEKGSRVFERGLDRTWARAIRSMTSVLRRSAHGTNSRRKGGGSAPSDVPESQDVETMGTLPVDDETGTSNKKPSRRKRRQKEIPVFTEPDEPLVDEAGYGKETSFPFPDFGVAYQEEPSHEDLIDYGPTGDLDRFAPSDVNFNEAHDDVMVDEKNARMKVTLKQKPFSPLAADPVIKSSPEGAVGGANGTEEAPPPYRLPDPRMLDRGVLKRSDSNAIIRDLQSQAKKLADTFESFGVQVKVLGYSRGPTVTRYEIQPAVGVKVSRILSLYDDLALALAARDIRIEAPIPGKSAIGIEVPNQEISIVTFREVIETEEFSHAQSLLSFALGKDIAGNTVVGDLAKMPHLLVAGATGSGKSVCINGMIASILFHARPDEVKLIMIDPKMVELGVYGGIPHLFAPVVTEARRAAAALRKVIAEMEHRYEMFHDAKVRDLERYNLFAMKVGKPKLPFIVVIIDELADLMMVAPGDVEDAICRLAQMARACGIHLVVATQRPSVDVITGLIKANIPSRIAFSVSSGVDSRTILDSTGAEKLLGRGDMLYMPVGASKPIRLQGAFLSESEVERLVEAVKGQQEAQYVDDFSSLIDEKAAVTDDLDVLFEEAVRLVVESEQASVSFLQRKLKIGYARASRIVDSLEEMGIVGPYDNSKPREVLITREQWLLRQSSLG